MSEEKQILQVKCEQVAAAISESVGHRCAVTLLAFYKHIAADVNAFASSLPDAEAIAITLDATVTRSCGAPLPEPDLFAWIPDDDEMQKLGERCRDQLPFHCGFILIMGRGSDSACATFEQLEHMRSYLVNIARPQFEAQAAGEQSPVGGSST